MLLQQVKVSKQTQSYIKTANNRPIKEKRQFTTPCTNNAGLVSSEAINIIITIIIIVVIIIIIIIITYFISCWQNAEKIIVIVKLIKVNTYKDKKKEDDMHLCNILPNFQRAAN